MDDLIAGGIRPPSAAGFFYPSSPSRLSAVVRDYLQDERSPFEAPKAIVAPHAGYDYSGSTAGVAYSTLLGQDLDVAIVLAPSHLEAFRGATIFPGVAYRTPLGDCSVAADFAAHMLSAAAGSVRASLEGHWIEGDPRQEHSLEVQLPFLQTVMEGPPHIVPLVIGEQTWETLSALARAVAGAIRKLSSPERAVIVASSDLSHFHVDSRAEELDNRTLKLIEAFDARTLLTEITAGKVEACGGGPVVVAMLAAQAMGATEATVLSYTHSGRVMGDNRSVVGYGAVRID